MTKQLQVKRSTGRPPAYDSPEQMEKVIEAYFAKCDEEGRPYTVPGLALALGFCTRKSLYDYEQKDSFVNTVKRAKLRIEEQRAEQLVSRQGSCTGLIFDLKNNFGWADKVEQEVTSSSENSHSIGVLPPQPKDMQEWMAWYDDYKKQINDKRNHELSHSKNDIHIPIMSN